VAWLLPSAGVGRLHHQLYPSISPREDGHSEQSRGGQRREQQRAWLGDGDAVRDEDAGRAVGETGQEGELAQVVESASTLDGAY